MTDDPTTPATRPRPRPRPRAAEPPAATDSTATDSTTTDSPAEASTVTVAAAVPNEAAALKQEAAADRAGLGRAQRTPKRSRTRRRVSPFVALAVVIALALAGLNIWLLTVRNGNDSIESARTAAMKAAETRIPAMLSYKYSTVNSYATSAPTNVTGSFRTAFTQLVTKVIVPAAREQQISTTATIKSVGVIAAHSTDVVLLVLIDQSTTSKSSKQSRLDGSRARVTMRKVGSNWLVADLTPV